MRSQLFSKCLNAGHLSSARGAKPTISLQTRSFTATGLKSVSESQSWINSSHEHTIWSWSAQKKVDPIVMARAEGIYFWDAEGKRYTDLNSQLMCMNLGHGHPKIIKAIKDQADELAYAGPTFATRVRGEIGPLLAKITPGDLNKFFFTLGGAEANENAIKIARMVTGRQKIIARYKAYHGATAGGITLTGDPRRWPAEKTSGTIPHVIRAFDPYMYRSLLYQPGMSEEAFSAICIKQLEEQIMYEGPDNIAAFFLETVTGTNGLIPPPKGYLKGVRDICTKYGIMMVCDEVMCGLGRCGEYFACDVYGVVPDLICMAKGLTSAYLPMGAVAMSPKTAAFFDNTPFPGGLTYNGHPMCLAVAVATLKVYEEEGIIDNARAMGKVLRREHLKLMEKHPCVGDARSVGLFGGLELVVSRKTKEPLAPYNGSHPKIAEMMKFLRDNGVFAFAAWNILHTNPPLTITEKQLVETMEVVDEALKIADQAYKE